MSTVLAAALAVGVILWGIVQTIISNEVEATRGYTMANRSVCAAATRRIPLSIRGGVAR